MLSVVSGVDTKHLCRLAQENLSVFFFLLGEIFGAEIVHLDEAELVGAGQRRQYAFAIDKLAELGHQVHALVAEKVIDEALCRHSHGALC